MRRNPPLIPFDPPLEAVTILRRYKRFLADVRRTDGSEITVHCPNSGSMRSCWEPGWPAQIQDSCNPARKLSHTLVMTHNGASWIGVHTQIPNRLVEQAILAGRIPKLTGYTNVRREVRYGSNSRIDILLEHDNRASCWVEIKNVTLLDAQNVLRFPDAVTIRGLKHLVELQKQVQAGERAVLFLLVQRSDGTHFAPAHSIDPAWAQELEQALDTGVELLVYRADVQPEGIDLGEPLGWNLQL